MNFDEGNRPTHIVDILKKIKLWRAWSWMDHDHCNYSEEAASRVFMIKKIYKKKEKMELNLGNILICELIILQT